MAIQLQVRRGTTAQNDAFTGAVGELTVNTDTSAIRVHDGVAAGGVELARSSQIDSLLSKSVAGAVDVTLSSVEAGNSNHEYTGILTGDINVIVPATSHNFTAENLTTGAFTLTVKTAAGTGILIPQGQALQLYCNGTNVEDSNSAKADKSGATFTGPVLFDTVADIASAATIDLTSYGSGFIATVTGTTPISALTMSDGQFGTLKAAGALPLTYHATTNKVSGGGSALLEAGDLIRVEKTGGVVTSEVIKAGPSCVRGHTANGYGGTNTHIARIATILTNVGSDITYADSAADGGSFTVNTSDNYTVSLHIAMSNVNAQFGVSRNSSQLTTAIASIAAADRLAYGQAYTASGGNTTSWSGPLAAGDVLRIHTDGTAITAGDTVQFTITRG